MFSRAFRSGMGKAAANASRQSRHFSKVPATPNRFMSGKFASVPKPSASAESPFSRASIHRMQARSIVMRAGIVGANQPALLEACIDAIAAALDSSDDMEGDDEKGHRRRRIQVMID